MLHLPRDAAAHPKHFREAWVEALLDHEIGTHFVCAHNDAAVGEHVRGTFAPGGGRSVATTRRNVTPREHLVTEEGLATINTHMAARVKLLWGPALAYWTRWMGSRMGFSELFEALAPHVPSPAARWTQCYRCKRGLVDTSEKRALAKDQCYLEGAWRLLEGRRLIDFRLLHSGRISMEEYAAAKSAWLKFSQSRVRDKCETVTPHFLKTGGGVRRVRETPGGNRRGERRARARRSGDENAHGVAAEKRRCARRRGEQRGGTRGGRVGADDVHPRRARAVGRNRRRTPRREGAR